MRADLSRTLRAHPLLAPAAGMLALTLLCGLLVPIYTDEIAWRFQLSRSTVDGGVDRGLGEQCGPNSIARASWFMQPMRHLSAWANLAAPDPRLVRIEGVALGLLWVGLFLLLARRIDRDRTATAQTLGLGLLGLGLTPLLLAWSRPEQPILLMLTLAILLALGATRAPAWLRVAAIVGCGVVALGYHPKAVVFLPIVLVAIACSGRGREGRAARIAGIAATIGFGLEAFAYWNARLACPDDPLIAAMQARESAIASFRAGGPLARALFVNALPSGYVRQIRPAIEHMSHWLPTVDQPLALLFAWRQIVTVLWWAALLAGVAGLGRAGVAGWRSRTLEPRVALAATIALTVLAWGATQLNKNVYEGALVLPLIVIALVLLLPSLPGRLGPMTARVAGGLAALGIANQIALLAIYLPPLARAAATPGHLAGQPYSFTPWGYPAMRREMLAAGRLCGIDPARARHLLVDDLTYFPYMATWRPLHRMATLEVWNGTITDPIAYLRTRRSSGAVVQCAILTPALRAQARARGQFCCLGPFDGAGR